MNLLNFTKKERKRKILVTTSTLGSLCGGRQEGAAVQGSPGVEGGAPQWRSDEQFQNGDKARALLAFFFNHLFFTELSRAAHGLGFF